LRIRHPGAWISAGIFIFVLVVIVFVLRPFDTSSKHSENHPPYPAEYGVQTFADLGRQHIPAGTEFDGYNSRPPTSGPHGPAVAWGVQNAPVSEESLVHNLEHGGVVIWYNCDGGPQPLDEPACDRLIADLTGVVDSRVDDGMYIVLTPYAEMDNRIALTAWQNLDSFDEFDEKRIEAFIKSFECKFDPENACR
jgi:hypothetical protein